jgi:hypothetical protein
VVATNWPTPPWLSGGRTRVRPFAAASLTSAEHREVVRVDVKPETRSSRPRQACEELGGRLDRGAAFLTDKVSVRPGCQVVRRRAMPEMGVDDHPEAFQFVEVAVDGRYVNVRSLELDSRGKLLRRVMALDLEQDAQKEAARRGNSPAVFAYQSESTLHRVGVLGQIDGRLVAWRAHGVIVPSTPSRPA